MFENVPENLVHLNYVPNVPDSWYKLGTKSAPLILSNFFKLTQVLLDQYKFLKIFIFLLGFLRGGAGVKFFIILLIFLHPSNAWFKRFPKIYNMMKNIPATVMDITRLMNIKKCIVLLMYEFCFVKI